MARTKTQTAQETPVSEERPTRGAVAVRARNAQMTGIDTLIPYAHNARTHSPEQLMRLRESLRAFGFVQPILIDEERNVLAGHGRLAAARAEGMRQVPCVVVTGLTEAERRAYILADNRLAELAGWDTEELALELGALEALDFPIEATGFDLSAGGEIDLTPLSPAGVHVQEHERGAPGSAEHGTERGVKDGAESADNADYDAFVEKFKPKLTTDDCYTPEPVYEAVRSWAVAHYALEGAEIVRPFYPGGDYVNAVYPEGCVVLDNPPFSILSEICRFFTERGIRFFLFAPALSLFSTAAGTCNYLPVGASITYENGAKVSTSFLTNLGAFKIETSPELYRMITNANSAQLTEPPELPNYAYPDCVMTPSRIMPTARHEVLRVRAEDALFVRALDAQREEGKSIYGGGFLLSEKAAAEKTAAEKAAAEKAAAEQTEHFKWELSERERALVAGLGEVPG